MESENEQYIRVLFFNIKVIATDIGNSDPHTLLDSLYKVLILSLVSWHIVTSGSTDDLKLETLNTHFLNSLSK